MARNINMHDTLKTLFMGIVCFATSSGMAEVELESSQRLPIIQNGKYGYIDCTGTVQIPPKFTDAKKFHEGLAAVRHGDKWGYIDQSGRFVIQPQFRNSYSFSEGLAVQWLADETGKLHKWVYIDASGKTIASDTEFRKITQPLLSGLENSLAGSFSEGRANIRIQGVGEGFIDRTGDFVVHPSLFRWVMPFSEGLSNARTHDGSGVIIDGDGVIKFSRQKQWYEPYQEGLMVASNHEPPDQRFGYLDKHGKWRIQPSYFRAWGFSEGIGFAQTAAKETLNTPVKLNDQVYKKSIITYGGDWYALNLEGEILFEVGSSVPIPYAEGLARVSSKNGSGYLNKAGKKVIEFQFTSARDFNGCAAAAYMKQGVDDGNIQHKIGYIDRTGAWIWSTIVNNEASKSLFMNVLHKEKRLF